MSVISLGIFSQSVFAQQQTFIAKLTGMEEMPPKNTQATGSAQFIQSSDGKFLSYKISVMNINEVIVVRMHEGKLGQMGPEVVRLVRVPSPSLPIRVSTVLAQGNIMSSDLEGPLYGKQISTPTKVTKYENPISHSGLYDL